MIILCNMKISIIISTYNRAASLLRTLESLAKQSADPAVWECVVVNNASTDDTASQCQAFIESHPSLNILLVEEPKQGLSHARNCGINAAKGSYMVFIDDDETVCEGFVDAYIDAFYNHGAFAAAGAVEVCYDGGRPRWMSKYPEKMIANPIDLGNKICPVPTEVTPAGGNMAFNREIFTLYGNFDTALGRSGSVLLGGEENDMFARIRALGERVCYVPNAKVYHHISTEKLTPEYFDALSYGVGRSKRLRAEKEGSLKFLYADERKKVHITNLLAVFYIFTFRPSKAKWLLKMRKGISKGVFNR
jgi:glycosyltransferase involved in cell wall biosynthesis